MKELIYFWVEKYRAFSDPVTNETKFLFNDFGVSLSSKYRVTHTFKDDETLKFEINETEVKNLFFQSSEEDCYYPKCISDIKVIVGKNGAGKTSLLELLSYIVSGNKNNLFIEDLKYCLLWIDNDGIFRYETDTANSVTVSEILFKNKPIEINNPTTCGKDVVLYSAVFNDEWRYKYPDGKLSKLNDIRTQYLIQQDMEDYNNNPDMHGLRNQLACHSILEAIRQVNFVSDFIDKEDFLSSIFVLPDKVIFEFSEGSLRNQIHSFLENFAFVNDENVSTAAVLSGLKGAVDYAADLNERNSKQDAKLKEIEDKWISFFKKTNDLMLKIQFALTFANMFKYLSPFSEEWMNNFDELDENLDEVKCQNLLKKIWTYSRNIISQEDEYALYECLKDNCFDNRFEFNLRSENVKKLLNIIFNLKLHVPFMNMRWNRLLSSGESCYLRMFARLYDVILNNKKYYSVESLDALFVVDEVDLYLHPEWQRLWLTKFIKGCEFIQQNANISLNFHLILATHSPFMLTDFFSESVVRLSRECDLLTRVQNSESGTLAANILDILEGDFFLDSSIGEFIRQKIKTLVGEIDDANKNKMQLSKISLELIKNIGDPIIKTLLENRGGRG